MAHNPSQAPRLPTVPSPSLLCPPTSIQGQGADRSPAMGHLPKRSTRNRGRETPPGHDSACFFWEDVPSPEIGLHPVPELKWEDKGGRVKELWEAEGLVKD